MSGQRHAFISYHRDDAEIARRVREQLLAHGASTWMDEFDIPVGAYWPDEIDRGLAASDTVIGILSSSSVDSRNVKNEWDWAIQNAKRLVLLQVEPCVIPHRYVSINLIEATSGDLTQPFATLLRTAGIQPAPRAALEVPQTHYARNGDVNIAFQVTGDGPVDLVFVPGFISHVELSWREPGLVRFLKSLASFSRLILFDKRGTGMSDRTSRVSTMEERMEDIRAVMDAAGSERAVVHGLSEGAPLSCLFAASHPERTRALIINGGFACAVRQADYPWTRSREEKLAAIEQDEETLHERWATIEYAREMIELRAPDSVHDEQLVTWFSDLLRLGGSPGSNIALDRMNMEIDVRHVLPSIRVPTLVVHRTGDRACNINQGRYVAEHIPGARFVELPGNDHLPWLGDAEGVIGAIREFVQEFESTGEEPTEPETVLATVLAVSLARPPRSDAADALRRRFEDAVETYRGRKVVAFDTLLMAAFDGPVRAIRCAAVVSFELAKLGPLPRIGLHTGEIALGPAASRSLPVQIAAQVAAMAEPGEVIVSSTVKDLVAGSGISFTERGSRVFEGLPDEWRIFAVVVESVPN
jgi:pimeloyl-ACP methyl ester carboxylesterase